MKKLFLFFFIFEEFIRKYLNRVIVQSIYSVTTIKLVYK